MSSINILPYLTSMMKGINVRKITAGENRFSEHKVKECEEHKEKHCKTRNSAQAESRARAEQDKNRT
jgi:hypothetical protein